MKISEVISELVTILKEHGDLEVEAFDIDREVYVSTYIDLVGYYDPPKVVVG